MKHIVSFSGGKDSTAMLLKMLEDNYEIDEIIFCDDKIICDEDCQECVKQYFEKKEKQVNVRKSKIK